MNEWIDRVVNELLPQLKDADEIIISHQITDKKISPITIELWKNIFYTYMTERGLSKNRNNALKKSKADICYICDDDLNFKAWFVKKIKDSYRNSDYDIITFQAEKPNWQLHFNLKEWKHTRFSVLKVWSLGITFRRQSLIDNNLKFDEKFWLGTKFPTWEENIFLTDSYKKKLKMYHYDIPIVIHPEESSGIDYNRDLIIARIKVFKRLFWFLGWFAWVFYFSFSHYKYYKWKFSFFDFFTLSFKSLFDVEL